MFVLNGNSEKILKVLRSCGLTEYESKAYFTLLLSGRSKMLDVSRKSSVPQSKIYLTIENLERKGLVNQTEDFPKTVTAIPFEEYLSKSINYKQKEIAELIKGGNDLMEIAYSLKPVTTRFKSYKVFEPKYRRR